jgi:hypothetical protein
MIPFPVAFYRVDSFDYLLDTYSGAAAAFSLRKLSSAYTGNCIEVRRSSDDTTQNISFVNNVLDTVSLLSFVGSGNGFVRTFYDQSGNGRNVSQTTNNRQPQIVNSGSIIKENGKNTILFDGVDDCLINTGTPSLINTTRTVAFVAKSNQTTLIYYFWLGTTATRTGYGLTPEHFLRCNGASINLTSQNGLTQSVMLTYYPGGGSMSGNEFYKNGSQIINGTVSGDNTLNTGSGLYLGTYTSQDGFFFNGNMQELIVWYNNQSSNISPIQSNMNNFYGIY